MKQKYTFWEKLSLKCVLVGDMNVGKSSLAARISSRTFKTDYSPTLFDNYAATVSVHGIPYHLNLFDTAGKEDFSKVRVMSYINSDVFLVCFSIDDVKSLVHVQESWVPELRQHVPNTPFILVGTKLDVRFQQPDIQVLDSSAVSPKQGKEVASTVGAYSYVEVSSLSADGVDDLITEIVEAAKANWEIKCAQKKKCPSCVIV
ncbi:cdc42 homolog [Magallana gigas]|uniref:Cdc42-like protein n=4 Tax=Magallana gigas TaxID=29159 RepID=K1REY7_MAGGI|nr:cdc42 homolog [Crassostrea gigas]|eukprot:XP_011446036.1 PREDICTED: cdc42 homolog [Crassostrea gigas]